MTYSLNLEERGTEFITIDPNDEFSLSAKEGESLELFDLVYRTLCSVMFNHAASGHPGGSISSGHIVQSLIFNQMDYDFSNPMDRSADIISYAAGHKALGLYAMWALRNEVVKQTHPELLPEVVQQMRLEDLLGFRKNPITKTPLFKQFGAKPLDGHPTPETPFVWLSTGPSGVGVASSRASASLASRTGSRISCLSICNLPGHVTIVGVEDRSELAPRLVQMPTHGTGRDLEYLGDLGARVPVELEEPDRCPLIAR